MLPLVWTAYNIWEDEDAPETLPRYLLAYDHYEAIVQANRRDLVLAAVDPVERRAPSCTTLSQRRAQEISRQKCRRLVRRMRRLRTIAQETR